MRGSWWSWDFSWLATTYFGSKQIKKDIPWTRPVFDAYLYGVWFVVWSDTKLYWIQKPTTSVERGSFVKRLHCDDGPSCANDVENLYFWHGVLVPAYAVVAPEMITLDEIKSEQSEEVRRILIERFGWPRYLTETKAKRMHRRYNERDAQWEELYKLGDGTQRFIVNDPSTGRKYALGCPSEVATCEQAQRFVSHGLDARAVHRS